MEIKEVESLLGVSRSNIRFYEKEGLIAPERSENNYRHYSADDVAMLRKIVVLRKVGFTVNEIRQMQHGELTLPEAAARNVTRLEDEIQRLQGALQTAREMERAQAEFDTMDECVYWDKITAAEQNGERFVDICKDCLTFSVEQFDLMLKWNFFLDFKAMRKKLGIPLSCGLLLLYCVTRGLVRWSIYGHNFWMESLYPLLFCASSAAFILPLYWLSKKHPNIAERVLPVIFWILTIVLAIAALSLLCVLLLILCSVGTSLLDWIF